jgi:hypothetical protein
MISGRNRRRRGDQAVDFGGSETEFPQHFSRVLTEQRRGT